MESRQMDGLHGSAGLPFPFDAHAHPGMPSSCAFVATASTDERKAAEGYRYRALGALPFGHERSLARLEEAAADGFHIGEIGIDRRYPEPREQEALFREALAIARSYGRIAVIHAVRADGMVYEALRSEGYGRFVIHGYTGSAGMAERFLSLGGMISLSRRAARTKGFRDLLALPFLTETDMPAGPEEERELAAWNGYLSGLIGEDTAERTWRMLSAWL